MEQNLQQAEKVENIDTNSSQNKSIIQICINKNSDKYEIQSSSAQSNSKNSQSNLLVPQNQTAQLFKNQKIGCQKNQSKGQKITNEQTETQSKKQRKVGCKATQELISLNSNDQYLKEIKLQDSFSEENEIQEKLNSRKKRQKIEKQIIESNNDIPLEKQHLSKVFDIQKKQNHCVNVKQNQHKNKIILEKPSFSAKIKNNIQILNQKFIDQNHQFQRNKFKYQADSKQSKKKRKLKMDEGLLQRKKVIDNKNQQQIEKEHKKFVESEMSDEEGASEQSENAGEIRKKENGFGEIQYELNVNDQESSSLSSQNSDDFEIFERHRRDYYDPYNEQECSDDEDEFNRQFFRSQFDLPQLSKNIQLQTQSKGINHDAFQIIENQIESSSESSQGFQITLRQEPIKQNKKEKQNKKDLKKQVKQKIADFCKRQKESESESSDHDNLSENSQAIKFTSKLKKEKKEKRKQKLKKRAKEHRLQMLERVNSNINHSGRSYYDQILSIQSLIGHSGMLMHEFQFMGGLLRPLDREMLEIQQQQDQFNHQQELEQIRNAPLTEAQLNDIRIFEVTQEDLVNLEENQLVSEKLSGKQELSCEFQVQQESTRNDSQVIDSENNKYESEIKIVLDSLTRSKSNKVKESLKKYKCFCFNEFKQGDQVRMLPECNHIFHVHCIDQWLLKEKGICPIDRIRVRNHKLAY